MRQETYLAFVINDVLNSSDPVLALERWQASSAARRRLLTATTTTAKAAAAAPVVDALSPAPIPAPNTPPVLLAPTTRASRASATSTRPYDPPRQRPAPPSTSTPRPAPAPTLSPAEARAQFERRLEIGGWFTGALFAVGGSLWATNLFWDDIPSQLRPVLVGVGLTAFATAFMAVGAMLAARHKDSLAGHVLGVVGRLIGVSATIPLAVLRTQNLPGAIVTDVVVMAALWWGLRFAHRRAAQPADSPSWSGARWFLIGFGLAVLAPTTPWLGIPIAVAALLLVRAAMADGTLPALSGHRTWVDDLSVVAVGGTALVAAVLGCRTGLDHDVYGGVCAVAVVAAIEVVLRLIEQRRELYGVRVLARWALAFASIGVAGTLISNVANVGVVLPAVALLFVAASFADPSRLSLPRAFRLVAVIAVALAAGYLTTFDGIVHVPVLLAVVAGVIFAGTHEQRRGDADDGERLATLLLWSSLSLTGVLHSNDGLVIVPALLVIAALWLSDRRTERSGMFATAAVFAAFLPVAVVVEALAPRAFVFVTDAVIVAVIAVVVALVQRRRSSWPLTALTTAVTVWTVGFAGTALLMCAVSSPPTTLLFASVALVAALFVLAELSRQLELALVAAALGLCAITLFLRLVLRSDDVMMLLSSAVVVIAAAAHVPTIGGMAVRVLLPAWSRRGRARHARSWSLVVVGSAAVALLGIVRIALMPVTPWSAWTWLSTSIAPLLLFAAVLLALRHRTRAQWALVLAIAMVLGADIGVAVHAAVGTSLMGMVLGTGIGPVVAWMGGGAAVVAVGAAVVVNVARMQSWTTVTTSRFWRRRRSHVSPRDLWWQVVLGGSVIADTMLAIGALTAGSTALGQLLWAVGAVFVALQAAVLFAGRAVQVLVTVSVACGVTASLAVVICSLVLGDDVVAVIAALTSVALCTVALLFARWRYRPTAVPAVLEAWPLPSMLRQPAIAVLGALAATVAVAGQLLQTERYLPFAIAYGPGVIIVGTALVFAALVAWRSRRSFNVALTGAAMVALVVVGIDGVAHAVGWLPPSAGTAQAIVACSLVGALLLLERDRGRAVLFGAGFGWPRVVRERVQAVLAVVVPLVALLGVILAVRHAPRAHELALVIAGVAVILQALAQPTKRTATIAAIGVVVSGAGIGAAVARLLYEQDAFNTNALPMVMLGGFLGCLVVQTVSTKRWALPTLRAFHAARLRADPTLFADVAGALRHAVEHQGIALLAVVVAVAALEPNPDGSALLSTWICMALAVVLTSRMAVDRAQAWPAAVGQGMALAIYVDIRRRTPWLDDVGGVDAIACLVGAAVFIAINAAARRNPRGASTARAAELYAVTLPVIAAGFGDSTTGRAVIVLVGGVLYALLSRTRKKPLYEVLCGVSLVVATMLALAASGADDVALYLMPVAFVGTFLGRRHRRSLGVAGRYLAVWCHVPLYCASAWTALSTKTFGAFALGIVLVTIGVGYAIKVKDRRSLYAAASAAAVLVVGRLVLLGLDNALLGTLLLAGAGIGVLAAMTIFTIRRDAATDAVKSAARGLEDWE